MTDFLIKSSVTMVSLLGLYHLFLEREKMHRFNRIYLLVSLAFSLALPFISFTVYKEVTEVQEVFQDEMPTPQFSVAQVEESINYTPYILLGIYLAITLVFVFRFINNLLHFKRAIAANATIKYKSAVLVLLTDKVLPHTFLHYIFINKQEYEDRLIEDELFTHELSHVNQKHTIDTVLIEVLLTIFWFNPVLYFYRKAIKLNHEFLADDSVVTQTHNVVNYQKLLLQKAVPATQYCLASSLNFSVTKKRFTMMTKATPKSKALLLKLASLPVIAVLIFVLCIETVAQTRAQQVDKESVSAKDAERDNYFKGVRVRVLDSNRVKILYKPYAEFTEIEKDKYLPPVPEPMGKMPPTNKEFDDLLNANQCLVSIDGKDVMNEELARYNAKDFAVYVDYSLYEKQIGKKNMHSVKYYLLTNSLYEKEFKNWRRKYDFETYTAIMLKDSKSGQVVPVMVPVVLGAKRVSELRKRQNAGSKLQVKPNNKMAIEIKYGNNDEKDLKKYEKAELAQEDKIYSAGMVTVQPEYHGGIPAFYDDIAKEIKTPELKETARVYVSFVIEKDGSMSNVKILREPVGLNLGAEIIIALSKTKKWLPATVENKAVRCNYNLPITFNAKK